MLGQLKNREDDLLKKAFLGSVVIAVLCGAGYYFWSQGGPSKAAAEPVKAEAGHVELTGILYSQDNPAAVIGSKIVHEGDVVDGVKVVKINKNAVEFEKNGVKWTQQAAASATKRGEKKP
jgi:type II secretory pathway component PulC